MHILDDGKISESEIQYLYQTHPYLIEKRFLNKKVIPQYPLPSGYADIVIILEDEIIVVELKVEPLQFTHFLQLKGYIDDFKNTYKDTKKYCGILVGKHPRDDFDMIINTQEFDFKLLILNKDICTKIKTCDNCRLANDILNTKCFNCSHDGFF